MPFSSTSNSKLHFVPILFFVLNLASRSLPTHKQLNAEDQHAEEKRLNYFGQCDSHLCDTNALVYVPLTSL